MKKIFCYLCLSVILFNCQPKYDTPFVETLDDNWQFKNAKDTTWLAANVPGNVYSDLIHHQQIPHPFIGDNEEKVQWVAKEDWEYETQFLITEEILQKKHIELHLEGLDTYAKVFLNDSLVLETDNAFRSWSVDIKKSAKPENKLRILFENTDKFETVAKENLGYELPAGNRIFTRKAQFQYGWDWGPILNTSGIWKSITLKAWNEIKIRDVYFRQTALNDSIANFIVDMKVEGEDKSNLTFDIYVNDTLNTSYHRNDKTHIAFQIKNPKRWWPHNLGEPYLYDFKVIVKREDKILDSISLKKGLRTIKLVTEKDSIGQSFYLKVNDVPVFMKGANYIPQHSLQSEVTKTDYEKILNDAVAANMNMLRVWGGGIYEEDIFYDLCDKKGILIWQDFMFACAMYPGDDVFLKNVEKEAEENIIRLRNHTSIALWCGNNENNEGWHRWGWQANRSEAEKEEIWSNYLKVFDSILPATVRKYSNTSYWESSPKYGRGNPKYKTEGDAHDWWIWHDAYPFEHLEENVPRFMSEFGFQSFPSYEAIKYINQEDTINIANPLFQSHQKHHRGYQLIREYMERDFPVPTADEDYVYVSQVLQAYGITKGLEAHRRAMPYCMGTLYWQLNDCWPVVSWSSIDYFGNWKALHYTAKHAFENVLISSTLKNDTLKTFVVNDNLEDISGDLSIKILDFDGKKIWSTTKSINVTENSSKIYHELDVNTLDIEKDKVVVVVSFNEETSNYYLVKPKDLKLKLAELNIKTNKVDEGFEIIVSSETLQKDVFLYTRAKGHFTDNFFDVLPNQPKTILFKTKAEALDDLQWKLLNKIIVVTND